MVMSLMPVMSIMYIKVMVVADEVITIIMELLGVLIMTKVDNDFDDGGDEIRHKSKLLPLDLTTRFV